MPTVSVAAAPSIYLCYLTRQTPLLASLGREDDGPERHTLGLYLLVEVSRRHLSYHIIHLGVRQVDTSSQKRSDLGNREDAGRRPLGTESGGPV